MALLEHQFTHDLVTLAGGSDPALSLIGQELALAAVLTPAEHTAIGDAAPHHTKYTDAEAVLAVEAANPLTLSGTLEIDTVTEDTPGAGVTIEGVTLEDSYVELVELGADPAAIANSVLVYAKDNGGVSALYYRQDDGTVVGPLGVGGVAVDEDGVEVLATASVLDFKTGFDVSVDGVGVDIALENPFPIGVDDTTRGILSLYGHGAGQTRGGSLLLYLSADHDAAQENWRVEADEDDLLFYGLAELARLKAEGQFQLAITGITGGILIGGDAHWYRGARNNMYLEAGDAVTILGGAGDFAAPVNGMLWYNSTTSKLRGYEGGAWDDLIGGGVGGGSITQQQAHAMRV